MGWPIPPVCLWLPRTRTRGAEPPPCKLAFLAAIPGGIGLLVAALRRPASASKRSGTLLSARNL
eukprot:1405369-Heterocapsa_arctica.AAC.1